jgi:hypothetical protein
MQEDGAPPWFISLVHGHFPSASMDEPFTYAGTTFRSAHVMASQNDRLILMLHHVSHNTALKLIDFIPMTGDTRVLPVRSKMDKPGCYGYAVLTDNDDLVPQAHAANPPPPLRLRTRSSAFLVILLYSCSKYTACRSYSAMGSWSQERHVSGAMVSKKCLQQMKMNSATVSISGAMFWPANEWWRPPHGQSGIDAHAIPMH